MLNYRPKKDLTETTGKQDMTVFATIANSMNLALSYNT